MRENTGRSRVGVAVIAAVVTISTLTAPPSYADEQGVTADAIADLVETAAAEATASAGTNPASLTADATVDVSRDPDANVIVGQQEDPVLEIPLPGAVHLDTGVESSDGVMVFLGKGDSPDVTVEALPSGARVTTVIRSDTADRSFDYALPDGVTAELRSDGRIELTEQIDAAEGEAEIVRVVGYVEPAWAIDAAGRHVPTSYAIEDGVLTQHVQTDAATTYPVVADPQWSVTSWNQGRIRWNRAETATIAAGGWGATGAAGACGLVGSALAGPPGAAIGSAACLAAGGAAVYTAGVAQNSSPKKCLEMYGTVVFAIQPYFVPWFGTYSGGSCR
ncbi:hypothetical protein M3672_05540 [Microbacterium enclense]|uniref:hypothetical protein n=1 Tax=Microbacterium enclense TaxID=993073 RepID=UPI00203CB493|nr:hypothetical protein [Microbacterium enclense]MCM3613898.1 hypothetical protein [Microbacterium enclense]